MQKEVLGGLLYTLEQKHPPSDPLHQPPSAPLDPGHSAAPEALGPTECHSQASYYCSLPHSSAMEMTTWLPTLPTSR